jgi:hypothetical protein
LFTDFIDDYSAKSKALQSALSIQRPDFRMRDTELLLRFLAFDYYLDSYRGNLKDFLDGTCKSLNQQWSGLASDIQARAKACDRAIETTNAVFGDDAFRTWVEGSYQGLFNRAVFDIMTRYFRYPEVAELAASRSDLVKRAFERACRNRKFLRTLQSTTKSTDAVRYRLAYWGARLKESLGTPIPMPALPPKSMK